VAALAPRYERRVSRQKESLTSPGNVFHVNTTVLAATPNLTRVPGIHADVDKGLKPSANPVPRPRSRSSTSDAIYPVLIHAILESFYDLYERGDVAPAQVIIWVKGTQKTTVVRNLLNCPGLPCPFLVRNLEDGACPTGKQLDPADAGQLLTQEKARLFSTWLLTEGLDSDPIGQRTWTTSPRPDLRR